MHFLGIFVDKNVPQPPIDYDKLHCADIPYPTLHLILYKRVAKCMIHGPCSDLIRNFPCMKDGRCTKVYPKDFWDKIMVSTNDMVLYRKRNNGCTIRPRNGTVIDNCWIVFYNPYLTTIYNYHINVNIWALIRSIKNILIYTFTRAWTGSTSNLKVKTVMLQTAKQVGRKT